MVLSNFQNWRFCQLRILQTFYFCCTSTRYSYNLIEALDQLAHLLSCPKLQILNLEFNPVTHMPNYRMHVIHRYFYSFYVCKLIFFYIRFPKLKVLDNKEIAPVERKKAEVVLKKEESILNMLFSNECLLMKLQLVRISLSYIQYIFFLNLRLEKCNT